MAAILKQSTISWRAAPNNCETRVAANSYSFRDVQVRFRL